MHEITTHLVVGQTGLQIKAVGDINIGGDQSRYEINGITSKDTNKAYSDGNPADLVIVFQNGTIPEVGTNGVTIEALLAICADRLNCFQNGKFKSDENQIALDSIETALIALKMRTKNRIKRGVEGSYKT